MTSLIQHFNRLFRPGPPEICGHDFFGNLQENGDFYGNFFILEILQFLQSLMVYFTFFCNF